MTMRDEELSRMLVAESIHYLSVVDLIAASNAPTVGVRSNSHWGVAQFRSAEGIPGRRPYAGVRLIDDIERLAAARAQEVFAAEHANVQPMSGALANLAAYQALMRPGDTMLTMSMESGGHLSHGHPRHISSSLYRVAHYNVDPATFLLDYDAILALAKECRPKVIVAGASAYPRAIDFARLAEISSIVGARLMADISHIAGLVAAGLHQNPCLFDAVVTMSVEKTLRGTRGGIILAPRTIARAVDGAVFPGTQSSIGLGVLVSLCALLGEIGTADYVDYQRRVLNLAQRLAAVLTQGGLGLVAGGTDTHLVLIDLRQLPLTGRDAEERLESVNILSNRNLLPFDSAPPFQASGLRLGTSTVAARGYDNSDVEELGSIIIAAILSTEWTKELRESLKSRVRRLANRQRRHDTLADLVPVASGDVRV